MKIKLLTLLAVLIVCAAAAALDLWQTPAREPVETAAANDPGQALPPINFTALDGRHYALAGLPEKGIILHFWASWCAPCALEFPPLLRKVESAHGDLALVAVSIDDRRPDMDKFIARLKARGLKTDAAHVYWVWDSDKSISLKDFETVRAPESVLIDSRRRMVGKIAGDPGWNSYAMSGRLRALAGGR